MNKVEALEAIQLGLLRDLARKVNSGEATGMELNVARGLLRDNFKKVGTDTPDDEGGDQNLPAPAPQRKFPDYQHDE